MLTPSAIADQLLSTLNELEQTLESEQRLLCGAQVDGSALQHLTNQKSALLATLAWLEQQRQDATALPGASEQQISERLRRLRELNQHNGWLLNTQMDRNARALAILQPAQQAALYGANGKPATLAPASAGGKKIAI
ncbi:flagellar export chaperone FlgN [Entomohabitans teleogrylli]|uniref:flagellar export chaperone FlgN n=1 Tax=Entomohabitans teleogrylli TaxID=1384589 RepID=UPI00073D50DC|nr:flagellar export chaperone FlgN [Entomohabitans teleogrylli]